ncbi:cyclic nucleotide-binding domain-containing protein [Actinoplanes oblitus]|uniref:Cyclic nucleotide-binding domain-containing protein n=1 Tax=Actinoplanes oblitus TaxID=3040509 RepID=A0ABY8W511_9ACTN|nr:cyclic nucleotide-binding domain-containing protein [Actinoplanes oblitus]WIM92934.1 cyclic nucleotide-binding domain-containing protein [Actinoplanes oblitus]
MSAQPFLDGLNSRVLGDLIDCGVGVRYPGGYRIFAEGAPADRFWLVQEGTVALGVHVPERGDQVLETLGAGDVLGWSWLYPPYRWRFGATTRSPVIATEFDAAAVRRRCAADTDFGYAILQRFVPVIGDRLVTTRLRLLDLWSRS